MALKIPKKDFLPTGVSNCIIAKDQLELDKILLLEEKATLDQEGFHHGGAFYTKCFEMNSGDPVSDILILVLAYHGTTLDVKSVRLRTDTDEYRSTTLYHPKTARWFKYNNSLVPPKIMSGSVMSLFDRFSSHWLREKSLKLTFEEALDAVVDLPYQGYITVFIYKVSGKKGI